MIRWMVQMNIAAPDGATEKDVKAYVIEALQSWGQAQPGTKDTDAPLFDGIEVRSIRMY